MIPRIISITNSSFLSKLNELFIFLTCVISLNSVPRLPSFRNREREFPVRFIYVYRFRSFHFLKTWWNRETVSMGSQKDSIFWNFTQSFPQCLHLFANLHIIVLSHRSFYCNQKRLWICIFSNSYKMKPIHYKHNSQKIFKPIKKCYMLLTLFSAVCYNDTKSVLQLCGTWKFLL